MSFTQDDLDALNSAIKTGAMRVRYSDREVFYRTLDEMLRVRDIMRADLGLMSTAGSAVGYASFSKGIT